MPGSIYLKCQSNEQESLENVAAHLFRVLNITVTSRHESSNYFGGEYFVGHVVGIKLAVALADDEQFSDYQFWITISADRACITDMGVFEKLADLIARTLALDDFQVARDPSGGHIGGPKLVYFRKASELHGGREAIEVKEVEG